MQELYKKGKEPDNSALAGALAYLLTDLCSDRVLRDKFVRAGELNSAPSTRSTGLMTTDRCNRVPRLLSRPPDQLLLGATSSLRRHLSRRPSRGRHYRPRDLRAARRPRHKATSLRHAISSCSSGDQPLQLHHLGRVGCRSDENAGPHGRCFCPSRHPHSHPCSHRPYQPDPVQPLTLHEEPAASTSARGERFPSSGPSPPPRSHVVGLRDLLRRGTDRAREIRTGGI